MMGIVLGLFLVAVCIFMFMYGEGGLFGFLGVGFVFMLGVWLIYQDMKKKVNNGKTSIKGEKCYIRILDCVQTGNFVLNKIEYKVIAVVYVSSLQKRIILEEVVGMNKSEEYPKDSFFSALYYNNDINIKERINENDIPNDILKSLKDEKVLNEYTEYQEIKKEEEKSRTLKGEEAAEKVIGTMNRIYLIYVRVILGIIIAVLLLFVLIDTAILKQTIVARNYVETTAVFTGEKTDSKSKVFDDYIYTFTDKKENQQEIIVSASNYSELENEIKIKYNENNPQDYYEESATMDKNEMIWYIVTVVALILLIILFFNKKLLAKVLSNVSVSAG